MLLVKCWLPSLPMLPKTIFRQAVICLCGFYMTFYVWSHGYRVPMLSCNKILRLRLIRTKLDGQVHQFVADAGCFRHKLRGCRAGHHVKSRFAVSWSNSAPAVSYCHACGLEESKVSTETRSRPVSTPVENCFSALQNYKKPHRRDNCLVQVPSEDSRLPSVLLTNVCHLQNKLDDLSVMNKQ